MSKLVAIIGGGPTGFAAARALMHESAAFRIHIFERQTQPGGVWVYTGQGPMYDELDTNIFKQLMEYKDRPFGEHVPLYPSRTDVWHYLDEYSRDVLARGGGASGSGGSGGSRGSSSSGSEDGSGDSRCAAARVRVHWGSTVSDVLKREGKWHVRFADAAGSAGACEADFVVVASGHYEHPNYPRIPGVFGERAAPNGGDAFSSIEVTHTRHYTRAEPYRGRRVLMVGNGSSGVDIAIQLLGVTAPVHIARRHAAKADAVFEEGADVVWRPEVASVDRARGTVAFVDGSEDRYDVVLFATGYLYRLPFLERSGLPGGDAVDPDGRRVRGLYEYMFHIPDATLAFVGFNKQVVPMPLAESQAAVIARVWSGRLALPSAAAMRAAEQRVIDERGAGEGYFTLGYPADVEYMHALNDWAEQAGPGGFVAERWGPEKTRLRGEVAERKLAEYRRKRDEAVRKRLARAAHHQNV